MNRKTARGVKLPGRVYPDLSTYIADSGDTQANIARQVGATQAQISRFAAGLTIPRPVMAATLAAYCRIPLDSFTRVYLAKRLKGAA